MFEPYAARTQEKMKDVLKSPDAAGPVIHYYMVRGGSKKKNVTILETGTVGGEYIKTYGHYHLGNLSETYLFAHGEGVALLQKRVDESDPTRIEEFRAVRVKSGDSVFMPPGYGHLMINIGREWLVMIDDSPVEGADDSASMPGHADYEPVRAMRGFAYYLVEHDGLPALVRNGAYAEVLKTDFGGIPVIES